MGEYRRRKKQLESPEDDDKTMWQLDRCASSRQHLALAVSMMDEWSQIFPLPGVFLLIYTRYFFKTRAKESRCQSYITEKDMRKNDMVPYAEISTGSERVG